jgi:flagellar FliL protein
MAESKAAAVAPGKPAPDAGKGAANTEAKKQKNLKPVILISAAVVLLGGGAGAYFALRPHADPAAAGDAGGKEKTAEADNGKEGKKPSFVEFEPFTSNLKDPEKFLQIKLTFLVDGDKAAESLKDIMPVVRSAIVPVLSSQDAAEIMTSEGKEKLGKQIVDATNQSIADHNLKDKVDAVLITHMIIQ